MIDSSEARRLKAFVAVKGFIEARFYQTNGKAQAVIFYREKTPWGASKTLARTIQLDSLALKRLRHALGKVPILDLNDWGDPITPFTLQTHMGFRARMIHSLLLSVSLGGVATFIGLLEGPLLLEKAGMFLGLGWLLGYRIGTEIDWREALKHARHRRKPRRTPPSGLYLGILLGTQSRSIRSLKDFPTAQLNLGIILGSQDFRLGLFWKGFRWTLEDRSITGRFLGMESAIGVGRLLGIRLTAGGSLGLGTYFTLFSAYGAVFAEGRLHLPGSPFTLILRGTRSEVMQLALTTNTQILQGTSASAVSPWEVSGGLSLRIF